jgi:hypothetical protein
LYKLKDLIDTHKNEFLILDCQHFYDFTQEHHQQLIEFLLTVFKQKIYEKSDNKLVECTLNSACDDSKQILIIYRNEYCEREEFWGSDDWPTPWPNQIDVKKLQVYLEETLRNRHPNKGFVSQCVLTPTTKFIIPR